MLLFAAIRDMSLNPISGYIPLKCCSELLSMFYKLDHPKIPATQPHSVIRLHNSRKPMRWLNRGENKNPTAYSPSQGTETDERDSTPSEAPTEHLHTLLRASLLWVHPSPFSAYDVFTPNTRTWGQQENSHCLGDIAHVASRQISRQQSLFNSQMVLQDWLPSHASGQIS